MPGFATRVAHALSREVAADKLKAFVESVRQQHADKLQNLRGQWQETTLEFAFTTYGMSVQGALFVEESHVRVEGTLPLAAALFRGQIEQTIRGELLKILGSTA